MKLLLQVLSLFLATGIGSCCKGGFTLHIHINFKPTYKYNNVQSQSFKPELTYPFDHLGGVNNLKNIAIDIGTNENIEETLENIKKNLTLEEINDLDITVSPKNTADGSSFKFHLEKESQQKKPISNNGCQSLNPSFREKRSSALSFSSLDNGPSLRRAALEVSSINTNVAQNTLGFIQKELPTDFLKNVCIEPVLDPVGLVGSGSPFLNKIGG